MCLRHSDNNIDSRTKARYHLILSEKIPGWEAPLPGDEARDPAMADAIYDSAIQWLIANMRDRKKFYLLHAENISYGYRRNLYGLKPVGLTLSILSTTINSVYLYDLGLVTENPHFWIAIFPLFFSLLAVGWWVFIIKPFWVKEAGSCYARALLGSCEGLE